MTLSFRTVQLTAIAARMPTAAVTIDEKNNYNIRSVIIIMIIGNDDDDNDDDDGGDKVRYWNRHEHSLPLHISSSSLIKESYHEHGILDRLTDISIIYHVCMYVGRYQSTVCMHVCMYVCIYV